MQRYILRRIILTIPVVLVVSLVLFLLIRLTPGDPARIKCVDDYGVECSEQQYSLIRGELGLDDPILIQYGDWLTRMMMGDFGRSLRSHRPVADEIWERLPATLELQVLALLLAIAVAVPLGAYAAVKRNSPLATVTSTFTMCSIAMPSFFVSTMMIYFLTYKVRIFETPRYVPLSEDLLGNLSNVILPVIALSHVTAAILTRYVRSSVLEVLGQDYVRTARAKGLRQISVLTGHVLRNALLPVVTLLGLSIGGLWAGSFITERIFNWPGIGRLATTAVLNKDYPMVQAVTFVLTITIIFANLVVDVAYAYLDPRIRYGRG